MIPRERLDQFIVRHEELEHLMSGGEELSSDDFVKISREYSDLTPVVKKAKEYMDAISEIQDLAEMIAADETDAEMRELAEMELYELKEKIPEMEHQVQLMLLPKDVDDDKNAMLEIRAGTGGDEAALLLGTYTECIKNMRPYRAGALKRLARLQVMRVVLRKLSFLSVAQGCLRNLNMKLAVTGFSGCQTRKPRDAYIPLPQQWLLCRKLKRLT